MELDRDTTQVPCVVGPRNAEYCGNVGERELVLHVPSVLGDYVSSRQRRKKEVGRFRVILAEPWLQSDISYIAPVCEPMYFSSTYYPWLRPLCEISEGKPGVER